MIITNHLVIGPDESTCTEKIDEETVMLLCRMGILRLCETVEHGDATLNSMFYARVRTNIYRKAEDIPEDSVIRCPRCQKVVVREYQHSIGGPCGGWTCYD